MMQDRIRGYYHPGITLGCFWVLYGRPLAARLACRLATVALSTPLPSANGCTAKKCIQATSVILDPSLRALDDPLVVQTKI